jgi:PilZ domain
MVARAWRLRVVRKFPRMGFIAPVEVLYRGETFTAKSHNLSVGGMLLDANGAFLPGAELRVQFLLPTGFELRAKARVVYCRAGKRVAVEFTQMETAHWHALDEAIQIHGSGVRRRLRTSERLFVRVYWHEGNTVVVAPAETTLLSRYGCLLLSEQAPPPNTCLIIWCPQVRVGVSARVVSRRQNPDGLFTVALDFARDANVWSMDVEAEDWRRRRRLIG